MLWSLYHFRRQKRTEDIIKVKFYSKNYPMVGKDIRKPFWWYTALTFCWVSWVCKTLLSVIMLYPKASLKITFNLLHVLTGAGS